MSTQIDQETERIEKTLEQQMDEMEKMLAANPQMKNIYDVAMQLYEDDLIDDEVAIYEFDGVEYIESRTIVIDGVQYILFLNTNDFLDQMVRKVVVEDAEEYLCLLDSDAEFDLVYAHIQKDFYTRLKEKLHSDAAQEETAE